MAYLREVYRISARHISFARYGGTRDSPYIVVVSRVFINRVCGLIGNSREIITIYSTVGCSFDLYGVVRIVCGSPTVFGFYLKLVIASIRESHTVFCIICHLYASAYVRCLDLYVVSECGIRIIVKYEVNVSIGTMIDEPKTIVSIALSLDTKLS